MRDRLARLRGELVRLAAEVDRLQARAGRVGRPAVANRPGLLDLWTTIEAELSAGAMSKSQAARELGISRRTIGRLLAHQKG
jgi:ActR/RegA family two-component response regulator